MLSLAYDTATFRLWCLYITYVCAFMTADVHACLPWHICKWQRTTAGIRPFLQPCWKKDLFVVCCDRWFQCFSHLCLLVCHRNTLGLWAWATLYSFSLGSGNSNSDPQHLCNKHCAPFFKSYFWVLLPSLKFTVLLLCCFDARQSLISRHYLMSTRKSVFVINLIPTLKI